MELLLIRHGQSEADLLDVHEGRADFPLTDLGRKQAIRMAEYISEHYPPDRILSSPLKRAHQTAQFLGQACNKKLIIDSELMELNNGVLAGLSREEAKNKYPLPENGRPIHIPIQGGESELDFRFRVEQAMHRILHEYDSVSRLAIVSHGGFISNFLKALFRLPVDSQMIFATGDTGFHVIEINRNRTIVKYLNVQEHLKMVHDSLRGDIR